MDKDEGEQGTPPDGTKPPDAGHLPKKNSSRRNAWGNMSYADLITQAIQSSPDKRLTLSQIYDWMVQNVPYFKDKGDSNSSAGWKNSIRHNLSLHNRFMRVQNEGTGKSSWWMINPDAKPGKAARRRATSMETQKYEKKRGRIKKKVEALRNGLDATPSPSSSISESLDMFPDSPPHSGFQLSPDFRPRASSNASSCGRLSPIPAVESDMHDSQVPPMSPIPWGSDLGGTGLTDLYGRAATAMDHFGTDQLVDTLAETMKLGGERSAFLGDCGLETSPSGQLSPHLHTLQPSQPQPPPPPQAARHASNGYSLYDGAGARYADFSASFRGQSDASKLSPQRLVPDVNVSTSYTLGSLQALSPAHSVHSLSPPHGVDSMPAPSQRPPEPVLSPHSSAYPSANTSPSGYCALTPPGGPQQQQVAAAASTTTTTTTAAPPPTDTDMLRAALTHKEALAGDGGGGGGMAVPRETSVSHMMGQLIAINSSINGMPNDLDLSLYAPQGGLECDVDQVIRHELSVDGNLDFNFPEPSSQGVSLPTTMAAATGGHHWVH